MNIITQEARTKMEGLTKEEAFFLSQEMDRMDTSIFDCLADEDEPLGELMLDDADFEDL